MKHFILDNSVTTAWCVQSQANAYTNAVLNSLEMNQAYVPEIWRYEIANTLLMAERRRLITQTASVEFLKFLNNSSITVLPPKEKQWIDLLFWVGAAHRLSAYDTAYLHLAMDSGWPLATKDKKLMLAAKSAGIGTYQP